ncbi:MAG: hypothetical protein AAF766_23145 [Cyanobacteria bacterium P01_D01_bin.14]
MPVKNPIKGEQLSLLDLLEQPSTLKMTYNGETFPVTVEYRDGKAFWSGCLASGTKVSSSADADWFRRYHGLD